MVCGVGVGTGQQVKILAGTDSRGQQGRLSCCSHPQLLVPIRYHCGMGINVRLTPEESRQLADLAAAEGRSKQQVITGLIRKQWNQHHARESATRELDDIFTQRSDLMDRLKDA